MAARLDLGENEEAMDFEALLELVDRTNYSQLVVDFLFPHRLSGRLVSSTEKFTLAAEPGGVSCVTASPTE